MRFAPLASLLLSLSALASAQEIGLYAEPSIPRVTTPSVTLASPFGSRAGASNATFGNVAGASNSTLSIVAPASLGLDTPMIAYESNAPADPIVYLESATTLPSAQVSMAKGFLNLGVMSFPGAAQLVAGARPFAKASRVYTNEDVERADQKAEQDTGAVKYKGKTEHLN